MPTERQLDTILESETEFKTNYSQPKDQFITHISFTKPNNMQQEEVTTLTAHFNEQLKNAPIGDHVNILTSLNQSAYERLRQLVEMGEKAQIDLKQFDAFK